MLRDALLSRIFLLEAERQPRKPEAWEEVADCVAIELETRAGARVTSPGVSPCSDAWLAGVRLDLRVLQAT